MAVVAISRKVGSYGEEIGALVAAKLGYRLISREEIHRLGQECDPQFKDACSMFESEAPAGGLLDRFFFRDPAYTALFAALNYELASQGEVVIMGRGAQIVLADTPGVCKVRVVAPTALRVERIMALKGVPLEEAREYVRRYDHQRRSLIESVYQRDLGDWSLYDLVVNTANMNQQVASDIVCQAVRSMSRPDDPAALKERLLGLAFAKRVESAIKKQVLTSEYRNVDVASLGGGMVELRGYVQDKRMREKAERIARDQAGVTDVENKLKTTELSW